MYLKSPYPDVPPVPETNAHNVFFNRPEQAAWPDYTAQIDALTGTRRSFRELVERIRLGATALGTPASQGGQVGLRDGGGGDEIVGIMSHNSMDYVTLVHALLAITTPFALISSYSTPFELKHALQLSKVTSLFVNATLLPLALPVAKELGLSTNKIYILGGKVKGRKSFAEMIEDARRRDLPILEPLHAKKDTLAYLVFSSGTSGLPKELVSSFTAVMISHGNIIYSIAQAVIIGTATAEVYTPPPPKTPEGIPVGLGFLPMYHSYGLHTYAFRCFLSPMTFVILPQWDIDLAFKAIPQYRVTSLGMVPSVIHQVVNHPDVEKVDFSSIQALGSGAAHLPLELERKFAALAPADAVFVIGYGMSEATIAAIAQPFPGSLNGHLKKNPESTGVLLPGMQARIVRDDGSDAGVNEVGELYLRSENIALGYWNKEKATRENFVDGWLRTGDRFRADGEGYFYFADRAKDTLKVSGTQVSPMEIETVLLAEPRGLVTDTTVIGVSGGRTTDEEVPRAWVVLSEAGKALGAAATIRELEAWHRKNLSRYKWLRGGIEVVEEVGVFMFKEGKSRLRRRDFDIQIPKSPTGKVLRRVLKAKYEHQAATKAMGKL
ncbi:hypothetical protein D9615_006730 [Tricholomella constricta]|uniref:AMP-dependent synthetase/ligase domain-containing protein n=1 Tax=Tricholomella constricta TaxID=117010 RepID=A0A8H5M274_9AGAR|nr:hypothetical protein D9615_006730 [Tricholomella constricta]